MNRNLTFIIPIIIVYASPAAATNLIKNDDFGISDLSGWSLTGNRALVRTPFFGFNGPDWDTYFLAFTTGNDSPNGTLAQTVSTNAGRNYKFPFDYGSNLYNTGRGGLGSSIIDSAPIPTRENVLAQIGIVIDNALLVYSSPYFTDLSRGSILKFTDFESNDSFNINGGFDRSSFITATAVVPKPASWVTMFVCFGAIGLTMRRRAKVSTSVVSA